MLQNSILPNISGLWRAWRLVNEDESASGWEPPLPGRTGAANAAGNPHADRKKRIWEFAVIRERAYRVEQSFA